MTWSHALHPASRNVVSDAGCAHSLTRLESSHHLLFHKHVGFFFLFVQLKHEGNLEPTQSTKPSNSGPLYMIVPEFQRVFKEKTPTVYNELNGLPKKKYESKCRNSRTTASKCCTINLGETNKQTKNRELDVTTMPSLLPSSLQGRHFHHRNLNYVVQLGSLITGG